jgi:hypothetical protein
MHRVNATMNRKCKHTTGYVHHQAMVANAGSVNIGQVILSQQAHRHPIEPAVARWRKYVWMPELQTTAPSI